MEDMRIGCGYDVHRLVPDRPLVLGGVRIEHEKGLEGHSDADVLIHALCDAMLGALALGDIGQHFPDTEAEYRQIDSRILLRKVREMIAGRGYTVGNADLTVVAQRPKLSPHISRMQTLLAEDLQVEAGRISVKATTSEGVGFEGREEGISAYAAVLLTKR